MRMFHTVTRSFPLFGILCAYIVLLASCSGAPDTFDNISTGTGSIAVRIIINDASLAPAGYQTAQIQCSTLGVSTIEAIVYDEVNNELRTGGPWLCSSHEGTITGVGAGGNRKVDCKAKDSNGTVLFQGFSLPFTVIGGQPNNVDVELFPLNEPRVTFELLNSSGNESVTPAQLVVNLTDISSQTITVDYGVSGGTATGGGTDYTLADGTLQFSPGDSRKNISINIVDDNIPEGNETIVVALQNPTNALLGFRPSHTYSINDNESASVTITETGGSTNVSEGGTSDSYTVILNSQPTSNVIISVFPDSDTNVNPSVLTFTGANWNIAQSVTVSAVDDLVVEGSHTSVIDHNASSSDLRYNGIDINVVTANVSDNDTLSSSVFYVNIFADPPGDGSSWGKALLHPQDAVDAAFAAGGGEVWVARGTYTRKNPSDTTVLIMKDGVKVYGGFSGNGTETSVSQRDYENNVTTLHGENAAWHVVIGANGQLDGFTITAGNATQDPNDIPPNNWGGGMLNQNVSPVVKNCIFDGNTAVYAGGMINLTANPTISSSTFLDNFANGGDGGAMYNKESSPSMTNCVFTDNVCSGSVGGGGIHNFLSASTPNIINCTFSNNSALSPGSGSAIFNGTGSTVIITNSILWGDLNSEISGNTGTVTFSDVQGGYTGTGNINRNPLFVNSGSGNYRLQSGSPCIDAGTDSGAPAEDIEGNPRPSGSVDMGAYEFF